MYLAPLSHIEYLELDRHCIIHAPVLMYVIAKHTKKFVVYFMLFICMKIFRATCCKKYLICSQAIGNLQPYFAFLRSSSTVIRSVCV